MVSSMYVEHYMHSDMYHLSCRHYVDNFRSDELLVFVTYDSDMHPFVPTMHSAFDLPGQDAHPERESVEARVICLMEREEEARSRL